MSVTRADVFDELAVVGKAFASAKRLELIDLLAQGERTVETLSHEADLGMSTTSAHLQVLKLSNLVRTRRDGTRIFYRLSGDDVASLFHSLRAVARTQSPDVDRALGAYLGTGDVTELAHDKLVQELEASSEEGHIDLIDVRPYEEFAAGHIPGATWIPFGDLSQDPERWAAREWGPGDQVVIYCRGAFCVMASDAVRLLRARNIPAVRLEAGMLEWRLAGRPVEVCA